MKDRILNHVKMMFFKHGYKNVKTSDLATELGISKRTLYENFSSKEVLLKSIINLELEEAEKRISISMNKIENDPKVDLISEIIHLWKLKYDSPLFSKEFMSDLKKYAPDEWNKINNFREIQFKQNFFRISTSGKKLKYFRKELNEEVVYLMILHAFQNILRPEVIMSLPYSLEEVKDTLFSVIFAGVLKPKMQKEYIEKRKILMEQGN